MSGVNERIRTLTLDEGTIIRRRMEVEHERSIAMTDLLHNNSFAPEGVTAGPYDVTLSLAENRLAFDISSDRLGEKLHIILPIKPFRSIIKDYFLICESYYEAIKTTNPSKVEAIDMGRRGIHNEGSELLKDLLKDKISLDFETARRLFTLICVLHIK